MTSVDSPEQALSALPALEGDAREAFASLENGAPAGGPPLDDEVLNESFPAKETGGPPPRAK